MALPQVFNSRANEFATRRQRRDRCLVDIIGKQRTKELVIDVQSSEVRSLRGRIHAIASAESDIETRMRRVEAEWCAKIWARELERAMADMREPREQADRAWSSRRAGFAWENARRYPNNTLIVRFSDAMLSISYCMLFGLL